MAVAKAVEGQLRPPGCCSAGDGGPGRPGSRLGRAPWSRWYLVIPDSTGRTSSQPFVHSHILSTPGLMEAADRQNPPECRNRASCLFCMAHKQTPPNRKRCTVTGLYLLGGLPGGRPCRPLQSTMGAWSSPDGPPLAREIQPRPGHHPAQAVVNMNSQNNDFEAFRGIGPVPLAVVARERPEVSDGISAGLGFWVEEYRLVVCGGLP